MNSLRKRPRPLHDYGHGVQQDSRGQDQPTDTARAATELKLEETSGRSAGRAGAGEQAQRNAAEAQPNAKPA
jgi:hypothetical protein